MRVDEPHHHFDRRSSPAAAKQALALSRISLAWRSSPTSRSSSLMRSFSALVSPVRCPLSRSACRHQTRRLSGEQPRLGAIARYAALSLI
jgi:hypothetical protein